VRLPSPSELVTNFHQARLAYAADLVSQRKDQNLTTSARELNKMIASHRANVERVIAHLQNWRLLATGYRGLPDRFDIFLDTITKLEIYRIS
jgi:hypothetical protein